MAYTTDSYDRERFERLLEIASELPRTPPDRSDFRRSTELGYPTPEVDVRCVAFRGNRVLMVEEKSSGRGTLPGGWVDANLTAAENAVKECREGNGFLAKARRD